MNSEGGHSGEGEYGEEEAGPEDRTIDQTEACLRSGAPVIDSVKIMAETVSVGGLHEEVAREIADEVTHRVKMLVQNAAKLMHHGQRVKLTCEDVDQALRMTGQEALYGFHATDHIFLMTQEANSARYTTHGLLSFVKGCPIFGFRRFPPYIDRTSAQH